MTINYFKHQTIAFKPRHNTKILNIYNSNLINYRRFYDTRIYGECRDS